MTEEKTKVCTKCGEVRKYSEYTLNKSTPRLKSGINNICKICQKENRDSKVVKSDGFKTCVGECGQTLYITEFTVNKSNLDGRNNLCSKCYRLKYKQKDNYERPTSGEKYCRGCNRFLSYELFQSRKYRKGGCDTLCRTCVTLRIHGLTFAKYEEIKTNQGDKCAICQKERELVVDHNHNTGKVRGLLCKPCNGALGKIGEGKASFEDAINYLSNNLSDLCIKYTEHKCKKQVWREELHQKHKKCMICNSESRLVVDHDHSSGFVRGLICQGCNVALGALGDSIEGLQKAIDYLKERDL